MKVFLSWSGDLSHRVACVLRDWLPSVLQFVKPYVSSEDIDKGARWSTDIAKELEASAYGVLVITGDNQQAPWVHFEAGALSRQIDKSRVSPFLFNIKRSDLTEGPLLQFQSTVYTKGDLLKLVSSINSNAGDPEQLPKDRMERVYEVWWPQLQAELDRLPKQGKVSPSKAKGGAVPSASLLEEILELAREEYKLLRSPQQVLPPDYLLGLLRKAAMRHKLPENEADDALRFLDRRLRSLRELVSTVSKKGQPILSKEQFSELQELTSVLSRVGRFLRRELGSSTDLFGQ